MSHLWIIVVQWVVVMNVATGQVFTIIKIQWVCLSKFHEWWEFEVPRYREELKARYKVLSFDFYFLSLFEFYANSLLSLVPLRLRQKWAPTPQEVLREVNDDDYEAPGWVTSAVHVIPCSGLQWLSSATYLELYVMTKWATVRFHAALWGGGARGSMAQYLLVAMMSENQRRPVSGGKTQFMTTNLLAMIPWQPVADMVRLSEKVEEDAVVPLEPVSTNYDSYELETALAVRLNPETKCWRVELKSIKEGRLAEVNKEGKDRETETDLFALAFVARDQLDPRPAHLGLVASLAGLGAVAGAASVSCITFGALAGLVMGGGVGFMRFGPKQGVPMAYIVDSRIIDVLVRSGVWHLVADRNAWKMKVKTVEFRDAEPPPVGHSSEWANLQGRAIVVVDDDGFKLMKARSDTYSRYGHGNCTWVELSPSHKLGAISAAFLDKAMALRLVRNGVDAGPLIPPELIRKVPINQFARVSREVIATSNGFQAWPLEGPVQIALRDPHEPLTFGEVQMKVRSDTRRTCHQLAIARVLGLLEDGAIDYLRAFLGVVLSFVCVAVAAWSCGLVAAGATACACVLALSCVVTGITGASVDMLSEVKHSVTVKYWRGPRGAFFHLLCAVLVLATLCGVFGDADLFWWALFRGLLSLVVGLFLGLFGAHISVPIAVAGCGARSRSFQIQIETATRQHAEIVVGAFAAAVFVFFRVFECGAVVKVMLDDGSWVFGRIEKIYDGDEKRETTYDIAFLDEGYDRRDFFVDLEGFEMPDPALPFAIGAPVVDLDDGRLGRIQDLPHSWVMVQFPYDKEPQSRRRKSLRVIPEAQAAPSVAQRADTTLLLSGVTATLPDSSPRIRSTDGKPDFICSVNTLDPDLNKALCRTFRCSPLVEAAFKDVDAPNQSDYFSTLRPKGGRESKLSEELQKKVNPSFCTLDDLSKMLTGKIRAHEKLLESLRTPFELAKAKAPPPGSRVAVRSSDGVDHHGTVVVALDETRATLQFDDGTANMTVDFPDPCVRVTRVGPADDVVADDAVADDAVADNAVEDEGSPDDAVPPFVVGQLVEADRNGQGVIYSGMIVEALADGTYKVKYDFGGEVSTEPPERISPVAQRSRTDALSYVPPPDEDNATPPKGSRVAVFYARGEEYEGTVVDVLDARSAVVQFDNDDIEEIDFSVGDYRVTRWGPGEPSPDGIDEEERELIAQFDQNQRERPKSDYEIEKEEREARNEAFLNSLGLGSGVATGARNGSGGEPAPKRRRVSYASYAVDEDFQPEEEDVEMA